MRIYIDTIGTLHPTRCDKEEFLDPEWVRNHRREAEECFHQEFNNWEFLQLMQGALWMPHAADRFLNGNYFQLFEREHQFVSDKMYQVESYDKDKAELVYHLCDDDGNCQGESLIISGKENMRGFIVFFIKKEK